MARNSIARPLDVHNIHNDRYTGPTSTIYFVQRDGGIDKKKVVYDEIGCVIASVRYTALVIRGRLHLLRVGCRS